MYINCTVAKSVDQGVQGVLTSTDQDAIINNINCMDCLFLYLQKLFLQNSIKSTKSE